MKLDHALTLWPVTVEGRVVLDVGASTGGFTEVCLERGAAKVFAVDVGQGQMHPTARRRSARGQSGDRPTPAILTADLIPQTPDLIVCDASFIGLAKVLPAALALAADDADLIALVKPQFEGDGPRGCGQEGCGQGSRRRTPTPSVASPTGWRPSAGPSRPRTESPITGGDGNVEFLLWARRAN